MNSAKTYSNLYKETKNLFESESKLPTNLEQVGEFYPIYFGYFIELYLLQQQQMKILQPLQ